MAWLWGLKIKALMLSVIVGTLFFRTELHWMYAKLWPVLRYCLMFIYNAAKGGVGGALEKTGRNFTNASGIGKAAEWMGRMQNSFIARPLMRVWAGTLSRFKVPPEGITSEMGTCLRLDVKNGFAVRDYIRDTMNSAKLTPLEKTFCDLSILEKIKKEIKNPNDFDEEAKRILANRMAKALPNIIKEVTQLLGKFPK